MDFTNEELLYLLKVVKAQDPLIHRPERQIVNDLLEKLREEKMVRQLVDAWYE